MLARRLRSSHLIATCLLLTATLFVSKIAAYRKSDVLARPLESISQQIAGFTGKEEHQVDDGTLRSLLPTSYLSRTYRKPGVDLELFIVFYAQQRSGESMHSPKHCLPGAGWEILDYGSTNIAVNGQPTRINQYAISRDGDRRVVLYWYQSRVRIIASEYLGKILLARDTLFRHTTAGSIVRIVVPDTPVAIEAAREFAADLVPEVQQCFGH